MRAAWVLGLFTLALIIGGLGGAVEPAAGQDCGPGECPPTVTPTATLVLTPTPSSGGSGKDGGRQGQDGGRHGQDGGRHGREEGRPDLTTLARAGVTVRRMPQVVVPAFESEDDFLDLSRR